MTTALTICSGPLRFQSEPPSPPPTPKVPDDLESTWAGSEAGAPLALICGLDHHAILEEAEVFRASGVDFRRVLARDEDDLLRECGDADALLVQYGAFTRRVFAGLPNLKVVVRYGVGVDGVDLQAATEHGVPVVNVPDYGTDEVDPPLTPEQEKWLRGVLRKAGIARRASSA